MSYLEDDSTDCVYSVKSKTKWFTVHRGDENKPSLQFEYDDMRLLFLQEMLMDVKCKTKYKSDYFEHSKTIVNIDKNNILLPINTFSDTLNSYDLSWCFLNFQPDNIKTPQSFHKKIEEYFDKRSDGYCYLFTDKNRIIYLDKRSYGLGYKNYHIPISEFNFYEFKELSNSGYNVTSILNNTRVCHNNFGLIFDENKTKDEERQIGLFVLINNKEVLILSIEDIK